MASRHRLEQPVTASCTHLSAHTQQHFENSNLLLHNCVKPVPAALVASAYPTGQVKKASTIQTIRDP